VAALGGVHRGFGARIVSTRLSARVINQVGLEGAMPWFGVLFVW